MKKFLSKIILAILVVFAFSINAKATVTGTVTTSVVNYCVSTSSQTINVPITVSASETSAEYIDYVSFTAPAGVSIAQITPVAGTPSCGSGSTTGAWFGGGTQTVSWAISSGSLTLQSGCGFWDPLNVGSTQVFTVQLTLPANYNSAISLGYSVGGDGWACGGACSCGARSCINGSLPNITAAPLAPYTTLNGSVAAPTCPLLSTTNFTGGANSGQYTEITGATAATTYLVTSTAGNSYLYITNATNVLVAQGASPLSFTTTTAGTYRVHTQPTATCATPSVATNFSVQLTTAPTAPFTTLNGTVVAPSCPLLSTSNFTGGAFGGQYVEITGATATTSYLVTSTAGNSYFYITNASNVLVAQGASPLSFTTTTAGTYRVHIEQAATCGPNAVATNFSVQLTALSTAPLVGIYNVPSACYPTLASMVTALNTYGISGAVTVNLNAVETAPTGGYILGSAVLNATTSATNTITFNGNNNLITAQLNGTSTTGDAVFTIAGTDYVTINQFSIAENVSNNLATTQMEWGIAGLNLTSTDGTQFCIVKNCNINLSGSAVNANEVGIFFSNQLYNTKAIYSTATVGGSALGIFDNVVIKSNTVNNCYNGIYCNNGSSAPTYYQNSVIIGGPTAADGNTITNYGNTSGTTTTAYVIACYYGVGNPTISNNTLSSTGLMSNAVYGIYPYYYVGNLVVSKNDITHNFATANGSVDYNIYAYSSTTIAAQALNVRIDSNNIHDIALGTGTFYGIYNYKAAGTGYDYFIRNNTINNITRNGISGISYGIYPNTGSTAASIFFNNRAVLNNTFSNYTASSLTGSHTLYCIYNNGYSGGLIKGNKITNIGLTSTYASAFSTYGLYNYNYGSTGGPTTNCVIDSNEFSNIFVTAPAANIWGTYHYNSSVLNSVYYTRNKITNLGITGGATTANVEGGYIGTNSGNALYYINNEISNLYATTANTDDAIKGIDWTGGTAASNFIYNNTINIGVSALLTSTGTNFGASGIAMTVPVVIQNNIIRVNATANGTGYVTAIRSKVAGVAGTVSANFATGSSNNILYTPTATNSNLYAECALSTAPLVNYNLTNDPNFNTPCGLFKIAAGARASSTFTENNLTALSTGVYAPSGLSYAESNAAVLASVTNDFNNTTRPATPDCGAVEFAGTLKDASGPTITYTPVTSAPYCTTLPTITATITDVSLVNTTAGTKPRLYYKKSTDANALVGNTATDNGWKYVEASNAVSPFTFTLNGSIMTAPPAVGDIYQYFITAQDMATVPNVSSSAVGFASGYCPASVNLLAAGFPTLAAPVINSVTLTTTVLPALVTSANPTTPCSGGSTTLKVTDTALGPQAISPLPCTPNYVSGGATSYIITNFTTTGALTNVNNTTTAEPNTYGNYYATQQIVTVAGASVGFSVTGPLTGGAYGYTIYADWDRNGTFNLTNEKLYTTSGYTQTAVGSLAIPATALGIYRLRVVQNYDVASNLDPCNNGTTLYPTYGETEDYAIEVKNTSGVPNANFVWTGGTTTGGPNKTVTATNVTSTTIYTVTATDGGGCIATSTISVSPATSVVASSVTGTTTYCSVTPNTTLTAVATNGSTPMTTVWTGGSVMSITGMSAVLNPPVGTTVYTVKITDACGTTSTTTVSVTVNPTPTVSVTPGSAFVCTGGSKVETATSSSPTAVFTWSPGALTGAAQTLAPIANTTYTVTATDGPCSATSSLILTMSNNPLITSISTTPATAVCANSPIQINSVIGSGIPGFLISSIPVAPIATPGSGVTTLCNSGTQTTTLSGGTLDDGSWNGLTIPFTFNYLGTNFTNFAVSTNGFMYLGAGAPTSYSAYGSAHPLTSMLNTICPLHADLQFSTLGTINYFTTGTAPNRKFVVNWAGGTYYSGGSGSITTQVILNETTNVIETHTSNNTNPSSIASVVGCDNATGTASYLAPGRNSVTSSSPEAYRFTPPTVSYAWTNNVYINDTTLANPIVSPPATTTYTVTAKNTSGCTTTGTVIAKVFPLVTGTLSATPAAICVGGSTVLGGTVPLICGGTETLFQGSYIPTNWVNVNSNSNGTIDASLAPASVKIYTGTNNSGNPGYTDYAKTIQCAGTVTFNWAYTTTDFASTDYPTYRINSGAQLNMPGYNTGGAATQSGTASITVAAGDVLHIQMNTIDNDALSANIVISNLAAPAAPLTGTISYWTAKTGGTNLGATPTVSPTVTTKYYAQYTQSGAGCVNPNRDSITIVVNPLPIVTASVASSPVCLGGSATFTGGGASTYTWNNGVTNGTAFTPTTAGTVTYTVTGTDANTCSNTSTVNLTVIALPVVSATASANPICLGNPTTLSGAGANTYTWNNGVTNGTPFTPSTIGSTVYTVTGTDGNNCSNTATLTLVVNALPTVTASVATSPICLGGSATFTGGGATTYSWNNGVTNGTAFTPTASGSVNYTVTGTDANNCSATSSVALVVNALPTVTASVATSPICLGGSATFTGGGATSYSWNNGVTDGVAFTPAASGSVNYTVTGTDANNCSATSSVALLVNALPNITATSMPSSICLGAPIVLNGNGGTSYSWDNAVVNGVSFTPTATSTMYTVTGTDANSCTGTSTIIINFTPVTLTSTAITSACPGMNTGSASISATGGTTPFTYTIAPVDPSQPTSGLFTGMTSGINYVVTGTDANGCIATTTSTATSPTAGGLANANANNISSTPGTTCNNLNQTDGSAISYYGATCEDIIATVSDGAGGNILGAVNACVTELPSVQTYNGQPYLARTYDITPTNQGPADITLYYTQDDFNDYNAAAGTYPQIPAVPGPGATVTFCISQVPQGYLPGAPGASTTVHPVTATWNALYSRWEVTFPVLSFSGFYCHACNPLNTALSAAITEFKGQKTATTDLLSWKTTSEMNSASFNILYSTNGIDYKLLKNIPSKSVSGYSAKDLNYSFEHETPALGHNYYKLEQVDIDGQKTSNTNVVDLNWGTNGSTVSIYPNPTTDELNVDIYTSKVINSSVKVLDMSGRVVKEVQAKLQVGANNMKLSLGELATGIYTVQVLENNVITQVNKVKKN